MHQVLPHIIAFYIGYNEHEFKMILNDVLIVNYVSWMHFLDAFPALLMDELL